MVLSELFDLSLLLPELFDELLFQGGDWVLLLDELVDDELPPFQEVDELEDDELPFPFQDELFGELLLG